MRQDFSLLGETGFHLVQFCSKLTQLWRMGNTEEKVNGNIILPDSSSPPNLSDILCQTNDELRKTLSPINFDSLFSRNRSLFLALESQKTKSLDPPSQFLWDTFINFLRFICSNCGSFLFPLTYFKGHISLHSPDMLEVLSSFPLRKYFALFHLLLFCDYSGSYLMWINKLSSLLHYIQTFSPYSITSSSVQVLITSHKLLITFTRGWSRTLTCGFNLNYGRKKKVESLVAIALTT